MVSTILEFHATEVLRSLSSRRKKKEKQKEIEEHAIYFSIGPCGKEICSNIQIPC